MTFTECVQECAKVPELVRQFDRLTGHHLSKLDGRSGIAAMIDDATGRDDKGAGAFVDFVWDCVWTRLPQGTPTL